MSRILLAIFAMTAIGCTAEIDPAQQERLMAAEPGDAEGGAKYYRDHCAGCHGPKADGKFFFPAVAGEDKDEIVEALLAGPMLMPSFASESDQQLADIAAHLMALEKK